MKRSRVIIPSILACTVTAGLAPLITGCADDSASYRSVKKGAESTGSDRTSTTAERPVSDAAPEDSQNEVAKGDSQPAADTSGTRSSAKLPPLGSDGYRRVTFDDLKFDIEKDEPFEPEMLTAKLEALDGEPIRVRGYILPTVRQHGLKEFVLVRDNMECCFGPGAALYDCIMVEMEPGQTTDYSVRPVAVEGTFSIRPMIGPGDRHYAVFHMNGQAVE